MGRRGKRGEKEGEKGRERGEGKGRERGEGRGEGIIFLTVSLASYCSISFFSFINKLTNI